jgi:excisionase family DNA binding protein
MGEILTISEVSEYLKVTERTLYRLAHEGRLPAFRVGGAWRFRRADLERWIAGQLVPNVVHRGPAKSTAAAEER